MISILEGLFLKISALFMSLFMTVGTTFGAFVPATTTEAVNYRDTNIKNVIYLIGDGMGFNHLEKTKNERKIELVMDSVAIRGEAMTRSLTNKVTDSAAGGTALATGMRVWINSVGVYPFDPFSYNDMNVPISLGELVKADGKATGVVTTDKTSGATPSDFSAHVYDRGMEEEICADQLKNGFDLIWGGKTEYKTGLPLRGISEVQTDFFYMILYVGCRKKTGCYGPSI